MLKIYLTSLHHYNNGELRGEWIALPCSNLQERIDQILAGTEEYAIHDYESEISHWKIDEHADPHALNSLCDQLLLIPDYNHDAISFLLYDGEDMQTIIDDKLYEDVQVYHKQNLKDVAYELVEEGCFGKIPDSISNYIDYDAIARDISFDGYTELDGNTYHRS